MSALNWQKMTARERDVFVSETIMEWNSVPNLPTELSLAPKFTTCPKAAMEVVAAMRARGFACVMRCDANGSWGAFFTSEKIDIFDGYAGTMPEAISLAALKACGVKIV